MNTELLEQTKQAILNNPQHLDMDNYGDLQTEKDGYVCGTTACIAGWAFFIKKGYLPPDDEFDPDEASNFLGIDDEQADRLFYLGDWPNKFKSAYRVGRNIDDEQLMAQATAARIDHFVATGGKE